MEEKIFKASPVESFIYLALKEKNPVDEILFLLTSTWDDSSSNFSNKKYLISFLYQMGYYSSVLKLCFKWLSDNKAFPIEFIFDIFSKNKLELTKKQKGLFEKALKNLYPETPLPQSSFSSLKDFTEKDLKEKLEKTNLFIDTDPLLEKTLKKERFQSVLLKIKDIKNQDQSESQLTDQLFNQILKEVRKEKADLIHYCILFQNMGRLDLALKLLLKHPSNESLELYRIELLVLLKENTKAIEEIDRLLRNKSCSAEIEMDLNYQKAKILKEEGKIEEALSLLQQITDEEPYYRSAQSLIQSWSKLI